jgi:hypothetical protein
MTTGRSNAVHSRPMQEALAVPLACRRKDWSFRKEQHAALQMDFTTFCDILIDAKYRYMR